METYHSFVCPLLNCTALTEYCVLCTKWTKNLFLSLFCSHCVFYFHRKKGKNLDRKLHFWGGAVIVSHICMIFHLKAPLFFNWQLLLWLNNVTSLVRLEILLHLCFTCRRWVNEQMAIPKNVFGGTEGTHFSWAPESNILYILHLDRKLKQNQEFFCLLYNVFFYSAVFIKVFRIC